MGTFSETFKKVFDETSGDGLTKFNAANKEATISLVKSWPVWMRCNFLLNSISDTKNQSDVNWTFINEVLNFQNDNYDFNLFEKVESIEDLKCVRDDAIVSETPEFNLPYFKKKCKQCGDNFILTRGEIDYFLDKKLNVPNRCKCCRKGIKKEKPKAMENINISSEKTAMQLAFEKAGISL